jgi:putative hemolysin
MNENNKLLQIDIEKVISGKNPKLIKKIPHFIINWFKRFVHQNEINDILRRNNGIEGAEFAKRVLFDLNVNYKIHSNYSLDRNKKYIFASNHPLGGLDGIILISYIGETFENIKFVVNDLLMHIKPFEPIFIPINKYGKMKHENAQLINDAFNSDSQILYFPAGLCSRLIDGKIQDTEWKKTFVSKAIEYKRDIVPIFFDGVNSKSFYRVEKIRQFLGIKFNTGTLCLPNEMFKQKNSTFDIYFGDPISYNQIDKGGSTKEWTEIIRKKCYTLKQEYGTNN